MRDSKSIQLAIVGLTFAVAGQAAAQGAPQAAATPDTSAPAPVSPAEDPRPVAADPSPQSTNPQVAAEPEASPVEQTTAASADSEGDIVVTAQRRSERIIDVPQTVNVVTAQTLSAANIRNSSALAEVVPGLSVVSQGYAYQPTIRGVGSTVSTVGSSGTVATYIDGVYQLAQGGNNFELSNISKIEVLKGPQGTLYGRNATGGVILITTKDPSFDLSGSTNVTVGNLDYISSNAYITFPVSDKIAANLSAYSERRSGYNYDIVRDKTVGDVKRYGARGKVLFELSDSFKMITALSHSYDSDPTSFAAGPLNGNSVARKTPGAIIPTGPYNIALNFDPFIHNTYTQGSITAEYEGDKVLLRSITAANFNDTEFYADVDASYLPILPFGSYQKIKEKVFSQELTASSVGANRLDWIAGLLYVRESGKYDPYISVPTAVLTTLTTSDSYSGFAELTFHVTDAVKVIGGVRYTNEQKDYSGATNGVGVVQADSSVGVWTPRASISYNFSANASVYATYSRGFRSGGWNASALSPVGYQPEYVTSYELGTKLQVSRLRLSGALYKYDFTDIQFAAATVTPTGYRSTILNAAGARIKGAEFEVNWAVAPGFDLQGGFAYTDAKYTAFPTALVTEPDPAGGNIQFVADAAGNEMIRTPKWTANLGANYEVATDIGRVFASGNVFYRSSQFRDVGNRIKDAPLALINLSLGLAPAGQKFRISAWVKNLTDEAYWASVVDATFADRVTWAPPRTFGATLSTDF